MTALIQGVSLDDVGGFLDRFGWPALFSLVILGGAWRMARWFKPYLENAFTSHVDLVQSLKETNKSLAGSFDSLAKTCDTAVRDAHDLRGTAHRIEEQLKLIQKHGTQG
jgi:hypothetical protein